MQTGTRREVCCAADCVDEGAPSRRLAVYRAADPVAGGLRAFWSVSLELLEDMSQVVFYVRGLLFGEAAVDIDLCNLDESMETWVSQVDRSLFHVEVASSSLLEWCALDFAWTRSARDLVLIWGDAYHAGLKEVNKMARVASRSMAAEGTKDSQGLYSCLSDLLNQVHKRVSSRVSKIGLQEALKRQFSLKQPVAAALGRLGALLPVGRPRSVDRVLAPVPARDPAGLISRNVEVVKTLAHLATMLSTRLAFYLASSPGMGKTHSVCPSRWRTWRMSAMVGLLVTSGILPGERWLIPSSALDCALSLSTVRAHGARRIGLLSP